MAAIPSCSTACICLKINSLRRNLTTPLNLRHLGSFSSWFVVDRPSICRAFDAVLFLLCRLLVGPKEPPPPPEEGRGTELGRAPPPCPVLGESGRPPAPEGLGRAPRSSASLTTIRNPMNSWPFISAMARSPPALSSISTKPKHLLCPVSRSVTTLTLRTGPMAPNHSNKSDSTASRLSLATKSFMFVFRTRERLQTTRKDEVHSRSQIQLFISSRCQTLPGFEECR